MLQDHPTHAWDYDQWLKDCEDDTEDETEENDNETEDNFKTPPNTEPSSEEDNGRIRTKIRSSSKLPPRHPASTTRGLTLADRITPKTPDAVHLDQVQNMSEVFNEIYQDADAPITDTPTRCSDRLARIPRRDYRRMHNFGE